MTPTEPCSDSDLRKTVLHSRHVALGANLAPFGGWEMPLWYASGAVREHLAVVTAAGMFDTSHMDVVHVTGESAREFLDYAFTRDLVSAKPGRTVYGVFLDAAGNTLDDAIVYPFADDRLTIVVNAGMGPVIARHLKQLPGAGAVAVTEAESRIGKIDVQGPEAGAILACVMYKPYDVFAKFPYFTFKGDFDFDASEVRLVDDTPVLLSRTGYTGELGFELFAPLGKTGDLWDLLLRKGESAGLLPCGLAARDSLRTGAMLPLSHQDIGPWPFINNPWTFALPQAPEGGFTKRFLGADALDPARAKHTLPFVGFDPRRVDPAEAKVMVNGIETGIVSTIVTDVAIGRVGGRIVSIASPDRPDDWTPRGLACGFVRVDAPIAPGERVALRDKRREIDVEIVTDIRPDRTARKKLPV